MVGGTTPHGRLVTGFHTHRLLVATPLIGDGNFERAVVLVLEHTADGAIGLVLNRPTSLVVAELLPGWDGVEGLIYSGGPVSPETLIGLALESSGGGEEGWRRIWRSVGSVDLSLGGAGFVGRPDVRVFSGYAGWEAHQLEGEITAGAWFVVDAEPRDAICDDPEALWRAVLSRQRDEVAWFRHYPDNPRAN